MTCQPNARTNHRRERIKDIDGWAQPPCQFFIPRRRLLDLSTKDGENGGGRGAGLELGNQRMSEKVLLRPFLVFFDGSIKDGL